MIVSYAQTVFVGFAKNDFLTAQGCSAPTANVGTIPARSFQEIHCVYSRLCKVQWSHVQADVLWLILQCFFMYLYIQ